MPVLHCCMDNPWEERKTFQSLYQTAWVYPRPPLCTRTHIHTETCTHKNMHTQFTLMWVDLQDQYSWNTPNLAISGIFFPRMTSWCLSRVLLVLVCFVLDRSMWVPYLKLPWGSMCTLMDGLRWDGSGNEAGVGKKEKLELIDLPNLLRLGKKGHHVQFFSPSLFGK